MSSGRVIRIVVNWNSAAGTSALSFDDVISAQAVKVDGGGSAPPTAGGGFFSSWFGSGADGSDPSSSSSSSSSSSATAAAAASVTASASRHPGALAVRMAPGGRDNILDCCIVRSAGPERPGEIILECVQLNAVSGVAAGSPQQSRIPTSLHESGTIDPIAAAYAHEVDAIVVLLACDVPSSFSLLQISTQAIMPPHRESKMASVPPPHRVVQLPSIHPGASFFQLLPCGPVTNRSGTSPAESMAYVSYNQRPGTSWGLVRARLSHSTSADMPPAMEVPPAAEGEEYEVVVSSGTAMCGRVLGGGVAQRRPHFLSTIPGAAAFTVSQARLLKSFTTSNAAAQFTPNHMREEPVPVRHAQFDVAEVRGGSVRSASSDASISGSEFDAAATTSSSKLAVTSRGVVEVCAEKAHAAVEVLVGRGGNQSNARSRSCFEDYDTATVEAAVNVLSGHVLDQGPRLSHSFVGIDRGTRGGAISRHKVAHKLIGHRLADKRSWLDALVRLASADSRNDADEFQGVQDVLRRRSAQLEAAISLYEFEQQQSSQQRQQHSEGLDIVSSARKEVVQGLRRLTPAALSSEGLSVADAFYGSVTNVAEVLPEIHRVMSMGPKDAALTLESVQACLAVVEPLIATTAAESTRRRDVRRARWQQKYKKKNTSGDLAPSLNAMLEPSGHRALYKILKHTISVIQSTPREAVRGIQTAHALDMLEGLRKQSARLATLLLEDIRLSLRGAEQGPAEGAIAAAVTDQGQLSNGASSLYTDTFIHIVLALLELGLAEEVQKIAEDHVHFETLFMVCRHMESTRGAEPAQQLMQSYLANGRIRCDEYGRANFPHYVYMQ